MNSPYMGNFKVTQIQHSTHDGLDLVGIDSKEIHSTVNGIVQHADWENKDNHGQGFGLFVCIYDRETKLYYYYGHLSEIKVKVGDNVHITDVIGTEGSTGYSTGSHCHYCARPHFTTGNAYDISKLSGIPNAIGTYNDGYKSNKTPVKKETINAILEINGHKYSGLLEEM
ncbi:MAG: M23 family metallopeptidase [Methanobrevibacter sp.]|nr:M23 family metallopeptidase [Methanobrevibacter sp.]MBO7717164.1 M23 family metallopeptidase [Methanobrevibacter sp.]